MRETPSRDAAIVTVGSELVLGMRLDTNTRDVAASLTSAGYNVVEAISVGDDVEVLAATIGRTSSLRDLVVVTGGLGPTHDDITREAASSALHLELVVDSQIADFLAPILKRHNATGAAEQVMTQALVLAGATPIHPQSGTAPGQIVPTPAGTMLLLPGPPHEMQPMLDEFLGESDRVADPVILRCAGMTESDAQLIAQKVLAGAEGISLTVLAKPSLVDVVLVDSGAGRQRLTELAEEIALALSPHVYARGEESLAEATLTAARARGVTIAVAESCTGGLLAAALTEIPGSSDVFMGGAVTYSNESKAAILGVDPATLAAHGAVSVQVAEEMAAGAAERFGADLTVAVTGIAGPDGGTPERPVGTVCFALCRGGDVSSAGKLMYGDRDGIRSRAVVHALQSIRESLEG